MTNLFSVLINTLAFYRFRAIPNYPVSPRGNMALASFRRQFLLLERWPAVESWHCPGQQLMQVSIYTDPLDESKVNTRFYGSHKVLNNSIKLRYLVESLSFRNLLLAEIYSFLFFVFYFFYLFVFNI